MIKTSIIIPVYNTAPYLERCIDSVLAQTQQEIEIILIDDGSTDGSQELIVRYADDYPNIRVIIQEHALQGAARNKGLAAARGEYVYYLDSDDWITPKLCETCYKVCKEKSLDFVAFDSKNFLYDESDRDLKIPDDTFDRSELGVEERIYSGPEFWSSFYNDAGIPFVCWLHYIRRDTALRLQLQFEESIFYEDNDWTLRLYMGAERMAYLPEKLHRHCWRRDSTILSGFTADLLKSCFRIHDVLCGLYGNCEDEIRSRMIRDVLRLNICRFDQLTGIDQSDKRYAREISEYCGRLEQMILRGGPADGMTVIHFAAAERILAAVRQWKEKDSAVIWTEMIRHSIHSLYPFLYQEKTIGIYGTGKISRCLLTWLSRFVSDRRAPIVFLHTDSLTGGVFGGCSVCNVGDIGQTAVERIIIASIYYRDSIKRELDRRGIHGIPVGEVPMEIRFLLDNYDELACWNECVSDARDVSGNERQDLYIWGLGWRCQTVLSSFPELLRRMTFAIDDQWPVSHFCGIPVLRSDQVDWEIISRSELVVAYEYYETDRREEMKETALEHGCRRENVKTLAQFVAEYFEDSVSILYHPTRVKIDISTICQLNCAGCYMRLHNSGAVGEGIMTAAQMKKLIEDNPWLEEIELSNSGEAFCNPEFYEILELLHQHHIRPQLRNGVNLNAASDRMLEALVRFGTEDVTVSIDGATQAVYSLYRRGGDIEKVFENIRKINEYKRQYGSDLPRLNWQFILMNHNQDEVESAVRKARELNMTISFKQDWRGGFKARDAGRLAELTGAKWPEPGEYEENEHHVLRSDVECIQTLLTPQINWDGRLLGCSLVYRDDWRVNVFDTPLSAIFDQPQYRAAVIALLRGEDDEQFSGPCRECRTYQINVIRHHYPMPL